MNFIYNSFRKDNILAAICIYITLIGLLVIIIKRLISRRIVQRIPKSNILPQPTNDQEQSFEMATLHSTPRIIRVGHINRNDTGDLLLQCWSSPILGSGFLKRSQEIEKKIRPLFLFSLSERLKTRGIFFKLCGLLTNP